MRHSLTLTINGVPQSVDVESNETLLQVLRQRLQLTGAKPACDSGACGACTIILNGDIVYSCLILAAEVEGGDICTVEGLTRDENLHAVQQAFLDHGGMQCGYCTSGMLMSARSLLERVSRPDEAEIRASLSGNLCRCTGYADIIKSIQVASRARR